MLGEDIPILKRKLLSSILAVIKMKKDSQMSELFEIAYAAATNRLCLFTGTGFSKEVSNGDAPTWKGLLEELCDILPNTDKLKTSLFPKEKPSPLSLEETA